MIRCIAIDDEPLALELIGAYISRTPFLELVALYTDAHKAVAHIETGGVDLLFLDIQMPEISGIEVAAHLDTFRTKVVFITAFDSYALEGFRVDAIDYLLKPVSYTEFLKSAQKARRLIENVTGPPARGSLIVRADHRLMKIDYDDILFMESLRDYVAINLANGKIIKTLSTLKGLESTLPPLPFARVHRSFIVNMQHVSTIQRNCIVFGKKSVPISEIYRDDVFTRLSGK